MYVRREGELSMRTFLALALLCAFVAPAQTVAPVRRIRTVGEGVASGKPDQAMVDVSVVTQASTAQDASSQNADKTSAVIAQLQQLLGPNASIRTINYSLNANYNYPQGGGNPTLTGFTAINTIEATVGDLSTVGRTIDTAIQAGATRVDGLRFSIKDDQPLKLQALRLASIQARSHADAIALGLGVHLGAVISAVEGYAATPILPGTLAAAAPTPVQPGTLDVTATVTVEIELTP